MAATVRELCRQKHLTVLELAEKTGLELTKVQSIYLGRWTPKPSEREAIAAALEIPIDDIVWGHTIPIQHIYGHGPG